MVETTQQLGMRLWWQRVRRICPQCGRKYARPFANFHRKHPGLCPRCDKAISHANLNKGKLEE